MSEPKKQGTVKKRNCSVPLCSIQSKNERRSFHFFPKNKEIRQQWINACKLGKDLQNHMYVCSNHFERSDFSTGPDSTRQFLKSGAIPSLNLPDQPKIKVKPVSKMTAHDKQISAEATSSDVEDNMTIIYLPSSCNQVITKKANLTIGAVPKPSTPHPNEDTTQILTFDPALNEDVTIISEKQNKISNSHLQVKTKNCLSSKNLNSQSVLKRFNPIVEKQNNLHNKLENETMIEKQENRNINSNRKQNKNIIHQRQKNQQIKSVAKNKYESYKKDVQIVTLCCGCGEYCKIDDEDLLEANKKNIETLAAETLLELQELYPSNEDERILLTKKGIEICDKVLQAQNINLMKMLVNDNELMAFTGINFGVLEKLTSLITLYEAKTVQKNTVPIKDRVVMCLCKLRTNVSFRCLSMLFGISQQLCTTNFFGMIRVLSILMEKTIYWPKTEELLKSLPKCFQSFKQTRVILSCNETLIEKQRCLKCQLQIASTMTGVESIKLILGVAPNGLIIFKSNVFESQLANNSIFVQTTILDHLDPVREAIMADKSLNIEVECAERNITLIKLPKVEKDKHFSKSDVELIKNIAAARIHVDRTLQRFKMFKIMQAKLSWRILPFIDDICTIIAGIVNMKNPIPPDESRLNLPN